MYIETQPTWDWIQVNEINTCILSRKNHPQIQEKFQNTSQGSKLLDRFYFCLVSCSSAFSLLNGHFPFPIKKNEKEKAKGRTFFFSTAFHVSILFVKRIICFWSFLFLALCFPTYHGNIRLEHEKLVVGPSSIVANHKQEMWLEGFWIWGGPMRGTTWKP